MEPLLATSRHTDAQRRQVVGRAGRLVGVGVVRVLLQLVHGRAEPARLRRGLLARVDPGRHARRVVDEVYPPVLLVQPLLPTRRQHRGRHVLHIGQRAQQRTLQLAVGEARAQVGEAVPLLLLRRRAARLRPLLPQHTDSDREHVWAARGGGRLPLDADSCTKTAPLSTLGTMAFIFKGQGWAMARAQWRWV
eukprot:scaffold17088_cov127-Isochrysis_galbana.AAC.8